MTDEDRRVLEFAKQTWHQTGSRDSAIYAELGMSPTRFWQIVDRLRDDPEAYIAEPMLVKRLRRLRDQRVAVRAIARSG